MEVASLSMSIDSSQAVTARKNLNALTASGSVLEGALKKLAAAWAAVKIAEHAKEAFMAAARYETLGVVMTRVGANIGYTGREMEEFAKTLQRTGISMTESRNTVIQMAGAQMDLANSSKLARIAQDAAVIGNINSSAAFQRLVHGIKSGETEILRTMGINVQFEQAYNKLAATLGKTKEQLSDQEKTQARTNAVMDYGKRISGAYEASMDTMGKQILSATRYVQDLTVTMGELIRPIGAVVLTPLLKWLEDASKGFKKFMESADGAKFRDNLINPLVAVADVLVSATANVAKFAVAVATSRPVLVSLGLAATVAVAAFALLLAAKAKIVITLIASTAAFVANTLSVVASGGAMVALSMATALADAALKKMGMSLAGVTAAAGVLVVGLAVLYAFLKPIRDETLALEEANRKMEARIKNVNEPLMEQRDIWRSLVKEREAYEDAKKAGKSDKEAVAAAAARKRELEDTKALNEFLSREGARPEDAAAFIRYRKGIQDEQEAAKKREESQKKEEDATKRRNDILRAKTEALRTNAQEEEKSIVLMEQGASAAYKWGLVHEKLWTAAEAETANRRRINQLYRESATALDIEAQALSKTAFEAAAYRRVRETGMDEARAKELASIEASNRARQEQKELLVELRSLQVGERQHYLEQAADKGVDARLASENWATKQKIMFTTELNKLRDEEIALLHGEAEAMARALERSENMTAAQEREVTRRRIGLAVLREEMDMRNRIAVILHGEAYARDKARDRAGMSGAQRASLRATEDEITLLGLSDPLRERRRQLAESERILGLARERGTMSAKRLQAEERNLLMSGMALRADGGSTWAAIGLAFANTNDAVSDGLTNWIMSIDQVENKWLSLRDTVRNVFASMLANMANAKIREGLQPLMDGAGQMLEKGGNAAGGAVAGAMSNLFGGGKEEPSVDISALTAQFGQLSSSLGESTSELADMAQESSLTSSIMELLGITTTATSTTTSTELSVAAATTSAALYELTTAALSAAAAQTGSSVAGAFAGGGTALAGRTYLVGEKGPELFTPSATGSVTPNDHITVAGPGSVGSAGGGGSTKIENNVSVTVVVESSGAVKSSNTDASNADFAAFGKVMEEKALEVIHRATEPGGILHANR